jgi:hypothetical protein
MTTSYDFRSAATDCFLRATGKVPMTAREASSYPHDVIMVVRCRFGGHADSTAFHADDSALARAFAKNMRKAHAGEVDVEVTLEAVPVKDYFRT